MGTKKKAVGGRRWSPGVTLRKDRRISIHNATIEQFGLQEMKFAVLSYDPERSILSITPSGDKESALPVVRFASGPPVIECGDLLDEFGIERQAESRAYSAQWDDASKAIVVKLG
jgi:hypothetical protein